MNTQQQQDLARIRTQATAVYDINYVLKTPGEPCQAVKDVQYLLGHIDALAAENAALRAAIGTLFFHIKHGDVDHQAWLLKAIEEHFSEFPTAPAQVTAGEE